MNVFLNKKILALTLRALLTTASVPIPPVPLLIIPDLLIILDFRGDRVAPLPTLQREGKGIEKWARGTGQAPYLPGQEGGAGGSRMGMEDCIPYLLGWGKGQVPTKADAILTNWDYSLQAHEIPKDPTFSGLLEYTNLPVQFLLSKVIHLL